MAIDAEAAVGEGKPGDYVLSPRAHAEELRAAAPRLADLLVRSRPLVLAEQYEEADAEALAAQAEFKKWVARANWSVLATSAIGALLMAIGLLEGRLGSSTQPLLVGLALLGILTGAFASMCLYRVKQGRLLEAWMTARARAETHRLAYFTAVVEQGADAADIDAELLKLAYFRRYQLDLQITYYRTRRSDHRASADTTLSVAAWSLAVAAAASGAAGFLGAFATEWAALGALAVLAVALQAFAASSEGINQNRRNAERYERTLQALQALRARLDEVHAGVAAGSRAVLVEFVAAVQDQISLEHRQWLEGLEGSQAAVGRLEEALAGARRGTGGGDGPAVPAPSGGVPPG